MSETDAQHQESEAVAQRAGSEAEVDTQRPGSESGSQAEGDTQRPGSESGSQAEGDARRPGSESGSQAEGDARRPGSESGSQAEADTQRAGSGSGSEAEADADETREALRNVYGNPDDGQHYNDRSKLDWDPADGVYSGTAVDGTSEIAGPHENQDDVTPEQKAEMRKDDDVTEGVQQNAAESEAAARETGGEDRTAETENAMRKEPSDVAAGQEVDREVAP